MQVGGRGKAGGIKLANNADEARTHAENILGMDIKGHTVEVVWIEKASDIAEEYYAIVHARPRGQEAPRHALGPGRRGDRAVAEENPDAIAKITIDPVDGLTEAQCREWVGGGQAQPRGHRGRGRHPHASSTRAYVDGDADLVEINPLILTPDGRVHALDAKVTLDDNAVFRHPDYDGLRRHPGARRRASRPPTSKGLQYVGLDGSVGVIANGAGLAMSTVDIVNQVGGAAGQLPRHRRRRQRRRDGRRARGHQQRPQRAVDLHQHLRRHHQGRGGRQRHRRRRSSGCRSTRRS